MYRYLRPAAKRKAEADLQLPEEKIVLINSWNINNNSKMPIASTIPDNNDNTTNVVQKKPLNLSFKQRKPLATRREEVATIRDKFPAKVPVIVERYHKETQLCLVSGQDEIPRAGRNYHVPIYYDKSTPTELATGALSSLVEPELGVVIQTSVTDLHRDYRDEDSFLYVTYASQEVSG